MCKTHITEMKSLIVLSNLALEELNITLENLRTDEQMYRGRNTNLAWHHINGLLIYATRISRILWGGENDPAKQRGEQLRTKLNISDDSIFHYANRKVRNSFDHVDERIDKGGNFNLDYNIGNDIGTFIGNMGKGDYARFYELDTETIYFFSYSISIPRLREELKGLEREVDDQLK